MDGVGIFMDRMVTLIQLTAVVYAIYLVMELKKQIDTMKIEVERRVEEVKEDMKIQWNNGWERHTEAMEKVEKRVDEVKEGMIIQWDDGWKRHNESLETLFQKVVIVEGRLDDIKEGMKTQWDNGWKRQNEAMVQLLDNLRLPGPVKEVLIKFFSVQIDDED